MSERDDGVVAFLAGLFIGGLVGAATALLLAPQSGEETRTLIKDKSIELKDKASETYEDYYARAGEMAESTKIKATELQQRSQTYLEGQKASPSEITPDTPAAEAASTETSSDAPDEATAEA